MNEFGEPNMGNPSVRFDEGRERVGHWPLAFQSNRSCLLYETEMKQPRYVNLVPAEFCLRTRTVLETESLAHRFHSLLSLFPPVRFRARSCRLGLSIIAIALLAG